MKRFLIILLFTVNHVSFAVAQTLEECQQAAERNYPGPRRCLCLQCCVRHWIRSQETVSHYLPLNCSLEHHLKGVSCKKNIEFKSDQAFRSSYQFEGIMGVTTF